MEPSLPGTLHAEVSATLRFRCTSKDHGDAVCNEVVPFLDALKAHCTANGWDLAVE